MMKKIKRLLAVLCSIAILFTMIPLSVLAESSEKSVKIKDLYVAVGMPQFTPFDAWGTRRMKAVKAKVIGDSNIYFAEVTNPPLAYTRISGTLEDAKADVDICDMTDSGKWGQGRSYCD